MVDYLAVMGVVRGQIHGDRIPHSTRHVRVVHALARRPFAQAVPGGVDEKSLVQSRHSSSAP